MTVFKENTEFICKIKGFFFYRDLVYCEDEGWKMKHASLSVGTSWSITHALLGVVYISDKTIKPLVVVYNLPQHFTISVSW